MVSEPKKYDKVVDAIYEDFKKQYGYDKDVLFEFNQQIIRYLYIDNEFEPMKLQLSTLKYKDIVK